MKDKRFFRIMNGVEVMYDLQAQLDKRLADLKKPVSERDNSKTINPAQIKLALQQSGILSKEGKVLSLLSA